jgi:NAD(P)-dependent dehydrogenase (short-subunit alcohol dehydrogenase family)
MANRLEKKVVLVMGGTSGIGLAAARAFLAEGARVVAVGRNPDKARAAARELGLGARVVEGDAGDPGTAPRAIATALADFGGFDGLYHVAGGSGRKFGDGPLHEISDEGWNYTLRTNLDAVFFSNRAAVRSWLDRKMGGTILNMSSVLAWSFSTSFFATQAYAAAKAGVIGLTQSSAARYASGNIRFNALAPGLVATPMSVRAQADPAILQFMKTKQPLDGGRIGQSDDLAPAAVFFMSDESRFVTGQVLAVDGGWTVSEGQVGSK